MRASPDDERAAAGRRKIGRPARLDRTAIARAAHEIGLEHVTMKAVAERLGVSVPGLYHHVEGRDDLMRLAAEYSASQLEIPVDVGQHWAEWLLEWARYSYDAFVGRPELLGQFLRGSVSGERIATNVDAVIRVLEARGFSAADAFRAYSLVSECAVGAAVGTIREQEASRAGRPTIAEYYRILAQRADEELPHLRKLVFALPDLRRDLIDDLATVLVGIAARRGESWKRILPLVRRAAPAPQTLEPLHP